MARIYNPYKKDIYLNHSSEKWFSGTHSKDDNYVYLYLPEYKDLKLHINIYGDKDNKKLNNHDFVYKLENNEWVQKDVGADNYHENDNFKETYKGDLSYVDDPVKLSNLDITDSDDENVTGNECSYTYKFDSYLSQFIKPFNMQSYYVKNINLKLSSNKLQIGHKNENPAADAVGYAFKIKCMYKTAKDENKVVYLINKDNMKNETMDGRNAIYYSVKNGGFKEDCGDPNKKLGIDFDLNKNIDDKDDTSITEIILNEMDMPHEDGSIFNALKEGKISFELTELWATDN